MTILQRKTLIANLHRLHFRNLYFMLCSPGKRSKNSLALSFGHFYYEFKKGTSINIKDGSVQFNADFGKINPLIGVLKMKIAV